jgi:hypothetical protein
MSRERGTMIGGLISKSLILTGKSYSIGFRPSGTRQLGPVQPGLHSQTWPSVQIPRSPPPHDSLLQILGLTEALH